MAALASCLFVLDVLLPRIAPNYTTKHLVEGYLAHRKPGERLLTLGFYTRGDTFYSANTTWDERQSIEDRGFFHHNLYWDGRRFLPQFLKRHAGERLFFMTWNVNLNPKGAFAFMSVPNLLPPSMLKSMRVVVQTENYVLLSAIAAPMPPSPPPPAETKAKP